MSHPPTFIPPMLLLPAPVLPDDGRWEYEIKLDGYRAVAFKARGTLHLRSRNDNDFTGRYPSVVKGLAGLPDDTVIDGEIVAVDAEGRPSFQLLQHPGAAGVEILYFVFDVMVVKGRNVMRQPLRARRELLVSTILPALGGPVRYLPPLDAELPVLIASVKAHGLEGLVAKRIDSHYEPGLRSGAWLKMRINRQQDFVIGGYTPGAKTFDALIVGCYEGDRLVYVARVRNGFTPAARAAVFARFRGLELDGCPFDNLPESKSGRWGVGLTAQKMSECRWLRPVLVARLEFLEWTGDNHLRHTTFIGLQEGRKAREINRE